MANTVNVNIKMDGDLKKRMEQACTEMGLTMSGAINLFVRKVVREQRIPFEINADPFYSESNIRYLKNIMDDVNNGQAHFEEHDLIEVD